MLVQIEDDGDLLDVASRQKVDKNLVEEPGDKGKDNEAARDHQECAPRIGLECGYAADILPDLLK